MLTFVVPGPLDQITGGYLFDRRIVEGARAAGRRVDVVELRGRFPDADDAAREDAAAALARVPDDGVVIIDGLALPAFDPCIGRHADRLRLVGFIHHPLSLETGMPQADAARHADLETRLWRHLRAFVCPSSATARALHRSGIAAVRIAVTPPGTDRPAAVPKRSTASRVQLLTVGTVLPRKGHHVLVEALALLRRLDWDLVCIGSLLRNPSFAAGLSTQIAHAGLDERIVLAGEAPPQRVEDAYGKADVFVLPSFYEGYGMAYAEALAHGLPIVATRAGAVPTTVSAEAAVFVEPGDVEALRDALERIIVDGGLRRRLARGAEKAAAALPSWPDAVAHWLASLDRLTS
jgi:glycosyltransferase involved in cell wall biosynthesis